MTVKLVEAVRAVLVAAARVEVPVTASVLPQLTAPVKVLELVTAKVLLTPRVPTIEVLCRVLAPATARVELPVIAAQLRAPTVVEPVLTIKPSYTINA